MTTRRGTAGSGLSGQRGFTVLELVVGVGLVVMVMGISSPVFSTIRNHYVLDGVSRQIAMEISKARMQAIAQNRTVRLRLDTSRSYVVEASEDGSNFEAVAGPVALPSGVVLSNGNTGTPRFNRQGVAPNSTTISVIGSAGSKTISTSLLGRVTRS